MESRRQQRHRTAVGEKVTRRLRQRGRISSQPTVDLAGADSS